MQDRTLSRRELFGRILGQKQAPKPVSPPYFCGEFDCLDCSAPCVSSCEYGLLSIANGRIYFGFSSKGCNFCKACALACESAGKEVLNLNNPARIEAEVTIDSHSCLAWNDTICYNCQDMCKYRAIDFFGMFRPVINDRCVGCAECLEVCFVNSIKLEGL